MHRSLAAFVRALAGFRTLPEPREFYSLETYRVETLEGSSAEFPCGKYPVSPEGAALRLSRNYPGSPFSLYRGVWTFKLSPSEPEPIARRTELVGVYLNGEKVSG
jgi:hypothetical protein